MEFEEEIREFLIESSENLANLDREIVLLEQEPGSMDLVSSAFRTIHTIKGTCGFFEFNILGSVAHVTENILCQVRDRERDLTPELISLILEAVDQIKLLLKRIETSGSEGQDDTEPLRERLDAAFLACGKSAELEENGPGETIVTVATQPTHRLEEKASAASPVPQPRPISNIHPVPQGAENKPAPEVSPKRPMAAIPSAAEDPPARPVLQQEKPQGAPSTTGSELASSPDHQGLKEAQLAESTIRVDVGLLNRLMNLVGELVLARNQLLQETSAHNSPLQQTSQRLNLITSELQEGLMKTRMQPIGVVWNKFPRVVRDLASKCGKRIQLELEGGGTELDKTILEAIKDPLTHIVRNSCDHGIELPEQRIGKLKSPEGKLLLRAYHEGGVVNIEISDDGAGINPEKVKAKAVEKGLLRPDQAASMNSRDAMHLIFMPGFSTAAEVTSISGRGVGMDVVKTNIEKIGGHVEVLNRAEGGTTVRIKIPLTLAIIPGLVVTLEPEGEVVRHNGAVSQRADRFIIPQANLVELVRVEGADIDKRIENVHSTPIFHHRGKLLPLLYLRRVLKRGKADESNDVINIIVLQADHRQLGLVVDQICDTQEIVVKPLGRQLKGLSCYVGATIMGDGRPALILDVAGLSRLAGLGTQTRQPTSLPAAATAGSSKLQMILLFRAGGFERLAVPLAFVDRLEEIATKRIERTDGKPVLHYRGDILPLVSLDGSSTLSDLGDADLVQLIVFSNGAKRVGLLVDQVLDIVSEAVSVRRASDTPGLLGSALIGGKITDLIDLHALVEKAGENWLDLTRTSEQQPRRLLLVDQNTVAREMITTFLCASGYIVDHAETCAEASASLQQNVPDALLISSGLADPEKPAWLTRLNSDPEVSGVPVIELMDGASGRNLPLNGTRARVVRSERAAILRAIVSSLEETRPSWEAA